MGRLNPFDHKIFSKMELKKEYDQISGDEDERSYNSKILVQRYWQRKRVEVLVEKSNCIQGEKILDIGCGSGVIAKEFAKKGGEIYGFDLSSRAVEYARSRNIRNTNFILADAHNIPFKSNYFDVVVGCEVIEHLLEPDRMIAEIARVLKNGGRLLLFTPNSTSLWPLIEIFWDRFGRGRNYGEMHLIIFNKKRLELILKKFIIDHFETPFVLSPYIGLLNSEKLLDFFDRKFEKRLEKIGIGAEIFIRCTLEK